MEFKEFELLMGTILLLILIYYCNTRHFYFWILKNIPGPKPVPFFGTIKDVMLGKISLGFYIKKIYEQYPNEPLIGIYFGNDPVLIVNNIDLLKTIMIKDFKNFMNRGITYNEEVEPLSANLILLEAERWRPIRTKLTPVFTSRKLKNMFYYIMECAGKLNKHLESFDEKTVDMRELSAKFTIDTIGLCAFGIEANALVDDGSVLRKMGMRIFDTNWKNKVLSILRNCWPRLYNKIGMWFTDYTLDDFFINLTKNLIEYRKQNKINRHDFIDVLATLKEENNQIDSIEFSDSLLAAQSLIFFLTGFEMASLTMSHCLFELALNKKIQNKVQEEINRKLKETDGQITYDMIVNMKYLDQVFKETLRKYPPVMFVTRKPQSDYTIPNIEVSIPKNIPIFIPVYAIHHDPRYYPNPHVFDPERFSDEEVTKRPAMSFLPFGHGPRNCIGLRFAQIQIKVGILMILQHHTVSINEKIDKCYTVDDKSFLLAPRNGIVLKITKQ